MKIDEGVHPGAFVVDLFPDIEVSQPGVGRRSVIIKNNNNNNKI